MNMKLYHIKDIQEFSNVINKCEGSVAFISKDGGRLNLKSKLSQFIALKEIMGTDDSIPELEISAEKPEDGMRLMNYLISA